MRKLILPAITALSISLATNGCLERRLEQDLPRRTVEITQEDIQEGINISQELYLGIEGFSHFGVNAITLAEIQVFKKYDLPLIIYSEREYTNQLAAIADSILCTELPKSNTQDLFEINTPYWHESGQYLLIMENFVKHHFDFSVQECYPNYTERPIDERFSVPYDKPMVAQTIHNIGHAYFDMLGIEKQIDFAIFLQFVDNQFETNNEKIPGHPSLLSYYSSIPEGFEIDDYNTLTSADDQFAEAFVYHILNHNYKDGDNIFEAKLNAVKKSLELFAKD